MGCYEIIAILIVVIIVVGLGLAYMYNNNKLASSSSETEEKKCASCYIPREIKGYRRIIKKEPLIRKMDKQYRKELEQEDLDNWVDADFCSNYIYSTPASASCSIDYKYKCQHTY